MALYGQDIDKFWFHFMQTRPLPVPPLIDTEREKGKHHESATFVSRLLPATASFGLIVIVIFLPSGFVCGASSSHVGSSGGINSLWNRTSESLTYSPAPEHKLEPGLTLSFDGVSGMQPAPCGGYAQGAGAHPEVGVSSKRATQSHIALSS
ncbi:hypothetical protein DFH07DRAFT_948944 [Mycena maculata]|uniref:Uncharacterized protein n=1 Tax=Mycena maculata TaxID=230809 RepID=A0AAD7KG56_9AGAR|nr:hypothetical protein DFH07DRAFT_948944 [Mycena maculata]